MATWTSSELTRIGDAEEMRIGGRRTDGTVHSMRIVWMVRVGGELYTRSINGPDAAWFWGTRAIQQARISAGGADRDVSLLDVDAADPVNTDIDAAYQSKYGRAYPGPTARIISATARAATLKIVPLEPVSKG